MSIYFNPCINHAFFSIGIAVLPRANKHADSFEQVKREIMAVNDDLCTDTFLSNLIAFVPDKKDDIKLMEKYLKAYPENIDELAEPDQFTIIVSKLCFVVCKNKKCSFLPLFLL